MKLNDKQLAYLAETERRFRERTPATDILAQYAATRVGRSEMRSWWSDQYGQAMSFDDENDMTDALIKLFRRLKREFPKEVW